MRISVPKRRVRTLFQRLLFLGGIFLLTEIICLGFFFLFIAKGIHLISPLVHFSGRIDSNSAIEKIKSFCLEKHLSCNSIVSLSDGTIQLAIDDKTIVFLSTQKDFTLQLASLQSLTSQLTIKGKQPKRIDFRFANVVVSF